MNNNRTERIELFTTKAGLKVFEVASDNLNFYAEHIENIKNWYLQIGIIYKHLANESEKEDYENLKTQLNFNALLSIAIVDLSAIVKQLYISHIKIEQFYYIKQGYLLIYSTIKVYHEEHSRFIKQIVSGLNSELDQDFDKINSVLRKFKLEHKFDSEIKIIRNNIAGHIDKDFFRYYNTITSLNAESAAKTLNDFVFILSQLQVFSAKLMKIYQEKIEVSINKRQDELDNAIKSLEELLSNKNFTL